MNDIRTLSFFRLILVYCLYIWLSVCIWTHKMAAVTHFRFGQVHSRIRTGISANKYTRRDIDTRPEEEKVGILLLLIIEVVRRIFFVSVWLRRVVLVSNYFISNYNRPFISIENATLIDRHEHGQTS